MTDLRPQQPDVTKHMHELRFRSGEVEDDRPLVRFLYLLMRNNLTCGDVEELMVQMGRVMPGNGTDVTVFTNGWLASYAQDVADRLER